MSTRFWQSLSPSNVRRFGKRDRQTTDGIVTSTLTASTRKGGSLLSDFPTGGLLFDLRRQQSFFEAFGRRVFVATFRPAGKSGETPDARRQWNLQTMDPKGRPGCPLEMQGKSTRILQLSIRTMLQRLLQTSVSSTGGKSPLLQQLIRTFVRMRIITYLVL